MYYGWLNYGDLTVSWISGVIKFSKVSIYTEGLVVPTGCVTKGVVASVAIFSINTTHVPKSISASCLSILYSGSSKYNQFT